mmetsp:Transcript_43093/g.102303  ORF Transcript_43093/g.102303 Transcript_43093/m.102303 type:complete len:432 (+) Transcript_43093:364-1659(+)
MACQDEFVRARERAAGFHEEGTRGGGEWGQPHLEPADELAEVRPLVRVLAPAEAHDLLQGIREVVPEGRAEVLLHDRHGGLERRQPEVGDLPGEQLPHDDPEREHVSLVVVRAVLDDLGRHPAVRARLRRHVAVVSEHAGDAEVRDLDDPAAVHQKVCRLEVAVNDPALVEVVHAPGDRQGHLDDGWRGESALAADDVEEAPIGHELKHDAQVGPDRAGADELHDVLVPDLLHDGDLLHELLELLRRVVHILEDLHSHVLPAVRPLVEIAKRPAGYLPVKVERLGVELPVVAGRVQPFVEGRQLVWRGIRLHRHLRHLVALLSCVKVKALEAAVERLLQRLLELRVPSINNKHVQRQVVLGVECMCFPDIKSTSRQAICEHAEKLWLVPGCHCYLKKGQRAIPSSTSSVIICFHGKCLKVRRRAKRRPGEA